MAHANRHQPGTPAALRPVPATILRSSLLGPMG